MMYFVQKIPTFLLLLEVAIVGLVSRETVRECEDMTSFMCTIFVAVSSVMASASSSDSDSDSEGDLDPRNNIIGFQFEPEHDTDSGSSVVSDTDSLESNDDPLDGRQGNTHWCTCTYCQCTTLSRLKEHKCCLEFPRIKQHVHETGIQCITENGSFDVLCLREDVLQNVLICLNNIRADNWQIIPATNRSLRWAAYRQYTWWVHGHLGRHVRRVIPACVVHKIRKEFPNPDGEAYEPYESDSDDND